MLFIHNMIMLILNIRNILRLGKGNNTIMKGKKISLFFKAHSPFWGTFYTLGITARGEWKVYGTGKVYEAICKPLRHMPLVDS